MFGFYLTIFNQKIKQSDSILKVLLVARHMILMMGFCAFYNGWIYNDFLSLSINLFGSCYHLVDDQMKLKDPSVHCTYPFGVDPVWSVSGNELTFVNSYKMKVLIHSLFIKLSVIVAVIQMSFGIILKGINSIYFRNAIDFIFEFIP